jgi:ribosomal protein S18 acetylase RimI-like enzyme
MVTRSRNSRHKPFSTPKVRPGVQRKNIYAMLIRPGYDSDADAIWAILEPVIRSGETYALPRDWSKAESLAFWNSPLHTVFVAEDEGAIVGTYFLRANALGSGAHVANCGYVTGAEASGRGVGRAMCEHSQAFAQQKGFAAMQFNLVVATNIRAVRLWKTCGFDIVGTLPGAFRHPRLGEVDAYVMHRRL